MENQLYYMLQDLVINIVLGMMVLILGYALSYIKAKIQKAKLQVEQMKDEQLKKIFKEALDEVDRLTEITVKAIEGEVAKELREALKDGKIDKEELKQLSVQAYEEIFRLLKPEYVGALMEGINDVDLYIHELIEAKLEDLKIEKLRALRV